MISMRYLAAAKQRFFSLEWKSIIPVTLIFFAVAVLLQYRGGVFDAEFGSEPDEAAHYVTGLFVRDYLAGGFLTHPKQYAVNYYNHYPKVALGHWPPGFYLLQSAWTLPFSPGRVSVMLLMAFVMAVTSTLVFRLLRKECGSLAAFVGGLLLLLIPLVQQFYGAVMTEVPITLLTLVATYFFGRYLETERKSDGIWFGLLASAAIMTKFSGLLLAFVPALALVFGRKLNLLKRVSFWIPAVIVAVLCVPWMLATLKLASDGMSQDTWGMAFTSKAVPYYAGKLFLHGGIGLLLFAAIGFVAKLILQKPSGMWAALGALLVSVFLLHVLVPCGYEARHLVPIFAPVILFAIAGVQWLADKLARKLPPHTAMAAPLALLVAIFFVQMFQVSQKGYKGFRPVALELISKPLSEGKFLISSDARGEGMFVSEVAMNEKRPGHIIQRGSKAFASSGWGGNDYKSKVADEGAILQFLTKEKVRYVVIDSTVPEIYRREHHELLQKAIEKHSDRFVLEGTYPLQRRGETFQDAIKVYRVKDA